MLTAIESAIDTLLADPNAKVNAYGVEYTRLDLSKLYDLRDRLRRELSRSGARRFALADRRADT